MLVYRRLKRALRWAIYYRAMYRYARRTYGWTSFLKANANLRRVQLQMEQRKERYRNALLDELTKRKQLRARLDHAVAAARYWRRKAEEAGNGLDAVASKARIDALEQKLKRLEEGARCTSLDASAPSAKPEEGGDRR